jgi:hypothetical protein
MFEKKLDKVIAGLSCCGEANKSVDACLAMCPYYGERDGDKVCLDLLQEDALEMLEKLREENRDLRKDIEVLTEELTAAREKLSWLEPMRTPNDWGEYPPEFPREGM